MLQIHKPKKNNLFRYLFISCIDNDSIDEIELVEWPWPWPGASARQAGPAGQTWPAKNHIYILMLLAF